MKNVSKSLIAWSLPICVAATPLSAQDAARNVYFGDLHLHTSYSLDAAVMGINTPDDAYKYAQGEAIYHSAQDKIQLERPLDFLAVTDHAEYVGVYQELSRPGGPLSELPIAKALRSDDFKTKLNAYFSVVEDISSGKPRPELDVEGPKRSVWQYYADTAAKHYHPGKFTTFIGFEWTSMPGNMNLHRNVIFGNTTVPDSVFSAFDSQKPEDLWTYMENARKNGSEVLSISHNGNISGGNMFDLVDSYGKPLTAEYAKRRQLNEIAHEVIQVKGQSEISPSIAPNDEFANFEAATVQLGTMKTLTGDELRAKTSFLREALKNGLMLDEKLGTNPFKFGIVAGSDSHIAGSSPEEDNFKGVHGENDGTPEARIVKPDNPYSYMIGSGGLTAIWAKENTREALFASLKNKETYGTSGTRLKVRLFGGWNFSPDMLQSPDWVETAYKSGVPMGGDLAKSGDKAPTFIVSAIKDAVGANLDRIQIIKGWTKNGETFDKIYDVALSGNRAVDASSGKAPPVGNTVDIATATYTNSIGATELSTVWTDPEFEPGVKAFYYARVLEIPTPRWSTYDAAALKIAPRTDVETTIQERAWTSPIWYAP